MEQQHANAVKSLQVTTARFRGSAHQTSALTVVFVQPEVRFLSVHAHLDILVRDVNQGGYATETHAIMVERVFHPMVVHPADANQDGPVWNAKSTTHACPTLAKMGLHVFIKMATYDASVYRNLLGSPVSLR